MRHRFGLALSLCCIAGFTRAAEPIDCHHSSFAVDRFVCADPALLQRIADAQRSYVATRRWLDASDRALFDAADRFWRWQRNGCGNVDRATGTYRQLGACVAEALDAQARYLRDARADPRSIRRDLAIFDRVDAAYLAKHARRYVDRHVSVIGAVRLDHCATPNPGVAVGHLIDRAASVTIRFDGLSDGQRDFLCTKRPSSSWTGIVHEDHGREVLDADDVLGAPLGDAE